jgi:hypothetical protein
MSALKQPTIRVVAIIAEGVPEGDTKQLIAYARANNKVKTIFINVFFLMVFLYLVCQVHTDWLFKTGQGKIRDGCHLVFFLKVAKEQTQSYSFPN